MSDSDDNGLPDTAMASGSDAGEPGSRRRPVDLAPDEQRLLAALERDAASHRGDAPEDTGALARAAEDEVPLPAEGGPQDDGLNPRFTAPPEV
jgi:hypothetical protein